MPKATKSEVGPLVPPEGHVTVRLYRIGHGDCFLLAFPRETDGPFYVLIDCGYKPGSPKHINTTAAEVCANLKEATGGHIHVVVVTHEHQDHVNGFTEANFKDITFGEAWFAWTEDPDDELANRLRQRFGDRLQLLMLARNRMAAAGNSPILARVEDFLAFEFGGDAEEFDLAQATAVLGAKDGGSLSHNKRALKLVRERCEGPIRYLRPHKSALKLEGVPGVRVYPLGPPLDEKLLHSLNPVGDEGYDRSHSFFEDSGLGFMAAALTAGQEGQKSDIPFAGRFTVPWGAALDKEQPETFWRSRYGTGAGGTHGAAGVREAADDAPWRRIDQDWLHSAEELALDMNNDTNNGSLVLAFELEEGGKVMLFAADAQRGNWISWSQGTWKDGGRKVSAKDLLSRTVLYKVGHHGSHNATLKGTDDADYANLDWMGQGEFAEEFTAMITAVRPWAETQKGWDHPLPAIKSALTEKSKGRVFQTDTDVTDMKRRGLTAEQWKEFQMKVVGERVFIDFTIPIQ